MKNIKFMIIGISFGILLTKAEVISWFRIQEMFRFQSIHMYGVINLTILVGLISLQLIKRYNIKTLKGGTIGLADKAFHPGVYIGGTIFGLGWALTGACPAPLFALVGSGYSVIFVAILMAILGTWVYGALREKLPH
ncbi:MAG: YeeE/YedE thiosulfate transporter family protein [Cyclobacteriaceae bacterium]